MITRQFIQIILPVTDPTTPFEETVPTDIQKVQSKIAVVASS
jgi:hypothetical protein